MELIKYILIFILVIETQCQRNRKREDREHWWKLAQTELLAALNVRDNWNVAKNVVLFLGDGMGITASTAARIYKGQKKGMNGEEGYLAWERFPNMALLKTYNVDKQVPDSAATATAYLCGVKTNYETIAVDSGVPFGHCQMSKDPSHRTPSVLRWAQEAGKHTGIVTTTRITHATPATTYAHVPNRRWECDSSLKLEGAGCKDIASQLISENPGKNIKVILGGGRQPMGALLGKKDPFSCVRSDGRNLVKEWLHDKASQGNTAAYVTTDAELDSINVENIDYLMGLFDESHLPYELDKTAETNTPSLKEMTLKAIKMLKKSDQGFFLLVEGGRIDHALHNNQAKKALEEVVAFDEAIEAALKELDLEETLVLTTADHSHVLTINGYPDRGNDILGTGEVSEIDGLPYTTLMFTNGPGYNHSSINGKVVRRDLRSIDTTDKEFQQETAVPRKIFDETHGGEDVAVYAVGPMAHLFHRLHEQHYVAHVMAHAACIGPSKGDDCEQRSHSTINQSILQVASSQPLISAAATVGVIPHIGKSVTAAKANLGIQSVPNSAELKFNNAGNFPAASQLHNSDIPNFPALSPVLQQLVNEDQDKIVNDLGKTKVRSFTSATDVRRLLGQHAIPIPHSM